MFALREDHVRTAQGPQGYVDRRIIPHVGDRGQTTPILIPDRRSVLVSGESAFMSGMMRCVVGGQTKSFSCVGGDSDV